MELAPAHAHSRRAISLFLPRCCRPAPARRSPPAARDPEEAAVRVESGIPGAQPRTTCSVGAQRVCRPASTSLPSPSGGSPRPTLTLSPQRRGPPWTWRLARQSEPSQRSPAASASAGATRSSGAHRAGCPTTVGAALGQRRGPNPTPSRPPRQPPPPAPPAPSPAPWALATTNRGGVRQLHFRTLAHVTQVAQALRRRWAWPGLASLGLRGGVLGGGAGLLQLLGEGKRESQESGCV